MKRNPTKIFCISDIHSEMYAHRPSTSELCSSGLLKRLDKLSLPEADVCILAGDIGYPDQYPTKGMLYQTLMYFKDRYATVIMVAGNHEYYRTNMYNRDWELDALRAHCDASGVILLNRDFVTINGVFYMGATLWSAIDSADAKLMNDFNDAFESRIDYLCEFARDFEWLKEILEDHTSSDPVVVITHHLPTHRLVHKRFVGIPGSTAYSTNVVDLLPMHGVKLWCCGHSHEQMEARYGDTKLILNPLGYPGEKRENDVVMKIFEV